MPNHAPMAGWIVKGERKWFFRCDRCKRRRLVCYYYEAYPPLFSTGDEAGWWYACANCMVEKITDYAEELWEAYD